MVNYRAGGWAICFDLFAQLVCEYKKHVLLVDVNLKFDSNLCRLPQTANIR